MGYILSADADKDIEEIALYTFEAWGEEQTVIYLNDLKMAFENISTSPHLGHERVELHPGVVSRFHQQHTIFYQIKDTTVLILRILHQSRDVHPAFDQ